MANNTAVRKQVPVDTRNNQWAKKLVGSSFLERYLESDSCWVLPVPIAQAQTVYRMTFAKDPADGEYIEQLHEASQLC